MDDRYFVCEDCAHTWCEFEYPDRCESCRRSSVTEFDNLEDAEEASQGILDEQDEPGA